MKVFSFDPATGRKGELVGSARRASWTGASVRYAVAEGRIKPVEFAEPRIGGEVTVHIDAGVTDRDGNDVSYRHATEWRCFCLGETICGTDTYWDWVVLPPSNLIEVTL